MKKTILITGSTDGIGLATTKMLIDLGHKVIIHGRNQKKIEEVKASLSKDGNSIESYTADLSKISEVNYLSKTILKDHKTIDILINNAGVYKIPVKEANNIDPRFMVNTIAPYILTTNLLPIIKERVINLSSAAQSSIDIDALKGKYKLSDGEAYAQSKLGLTMWSHQLAEEIRDKGPIIIAINPASFLGSKMVKEAYGISGHDINIGAKVITAAATSDYFKNASGKYFDNDKGQFALPHTDALDENKSKELIQTIKTIIKEKNND